MNPLDKFMLLGSLTFFFAALAVSLVTLNNTGSPSSYMYSPAAIEPEQKQPLASVRREYSDLPKSVLHYPIDGTDNNHKNTVTCYLDGDYETLVADKKSAGAVLKVKAVMDDDALEIYAGADGQFHAYVIGPDASGRREACEVASGSGWEQPSP